MDRSAHFSPCRQYRYILDRVWDAGKPTVMFVGLNPSTADECVDDPTIRRCMGFARDWGYGALVMVNLFAYRATHPSVLSEVADPVGPRNDYWLMAASRRVELILAAWGIHGTLRGRDAAALGKLKCVHCLGTTKAGHPRHPLYLPRRVTPTPYQF
jgi:hypothetical protein